MLKIGNFKIRFLLPFLFLAANLLLKSFYLHFSDLAGDEPFTVFYAQVDLNAFLDMLDNENNPPLFFVLIHFWIKLFGIGPYSVRFLPMIFSSATVLFIYETGRKFFNLRTAIVTSLLFTFSNYHISFSHECRVYSLFAMLTALSMYAFMSMVRENPARKFRILLLISNTMLIYSHFFGFLVIFIQFISVFVLAPVRAKLIRAYSGITLIVLAFYIPYFKIFTHRFLSSSGGTWLEEPTLESLYNNLWSFSNAPVPTVWFILVILTGLVFGYATRRNRPELHKPYTEIVIIWFLPLYLILFAVSYVIPVFLNRYLVFISIAYYLLIAIAIDTLGKKKIVFYSLAAVSVFIMVYTSDPKSGINRKTSDMVDVIRSLKTPDTPVYICPPWIDLTFAYYYDIAVFKDYTNTAQKLRADLVFPIYRADEVDDSLLKVSGEAIYLDGWSELVDADNSIYKRLESRYANVKENDSFPGFRIYHFTR